MRKNFFVHYILILALSLIVCPNTGMPSFAQEKSKTDSSPKENRYIYTYCVKKDQSEDAKALNVFLDGYLNALNSHDLKKIGDFYASNYVSGDGFKKAEMLDLVKQTLEKCPDIKYSTTVKNLRLENNRASIELNEDVTATTQDKSEITKDNGVVKGNSQSILYLVKYGSGWFIVSDKTLYEETVVKYGTAKKINVSFQTPEQILSGENYTASVKVDMPSDIFGLGSITSVPLIYPAKQPEETFRQIPSEINTLERVIKSNKNCLNEIASASLSFCEAERTSYTSLNLKVSGITVILKRVNVIPKGK